jgi:hypothetical protein
MIIPLCFSWSTLPAIVAVMSIFIFDLSTTQEKGNTGTLPHPLTTTAPTNYESIPFFICVTVVLVPQLAVYPRVFNTVVFLYTPWVLPATRGLAPLMGAVTRVAGVVQVDHTQG